ncbi:MAG TPA: phosphoribosyltransferase family protein [Yinghuangia sp.]|nr:phosphoribosyltransferase family protein [Yinghuangia sp.]
MANVTGAFRVPCWLAPLYRGISVVIVDDLVTTGASLAEATRAVASGGGKVSGAAVVAATPRRSVRGPARSPFPISPALRTRGGRPARPDGRTAHRQGARDGVLRGHCRQGPQDRCARAVPQTQRREAGQDPQARRQGDQRRP